MEDKSLKPLSKTKEGLCPYCNAVLSFSKEDRIEKTQIKCPKCDKFFLITEAKKITKEKTPKKAKNVCPKCGSSNVRLENETEVVTKRRGCLGWLLWILLAVFTLGLILIIPLITNSKVKSKSKVVGICQECGHKWKL